MAAETSQTLDRGLRVLSILGSSPEGMTITEIAGALEVSRTVVYRLVGTLAVHDLVHRGVDGRVRLAVGLLGLARSAVEAVADAAAPAVRRLADQTLSTAHATIADGPDALVVAVAEPPRLEGLVPIRPGLRHLLERSTVGRALTAGSHDREGAYTVNEGDSAGPQAVRLVEIVAVIHGIPGLRAAVGVVSPEAIDPSTVGPLVVRAANEVARVLR